MVVNGTLLIGMFRVRRNEHDLFGPGGWTMTMVLRQCLGFVGVSKRDVVLCVLFVFVYGLKGDVVYVLSNVLFMFIG